MPAKKTAKKSASKKRKKAPASTKKVTAKKAAARKPASKKRKVTKKKAAASSRKKAASKKKISKKKVTAKKSTAKKKPAKKKAAKKKSVSRKTSTKKTSTKKKATGKKPAKKASSKRTSSKKGTSRTVSTKQSVVKKATTKKTPARRSRPSGNLLSGPIHGIEPYKPKRGEEYMSPEQLEHFRNILTSWKRELMYEVDRTVHHMQDEAANFPDPNDRATQESEFGLELRTRDRERKLLRKIDSALARIDDGTYGWCDETGEEIGLKRLEARPVATLCLEAQERRELAERQFRDRDDRYR